MIYQFFLLFLFFCTGLNAECPCKQRKPLPTLFEQELQAAISLAKQGNISLIYQSLKERFPSYGLAMQEPRSSWVHQTYVWVVVENFDLIQIGLMKNGRPVLGVYYLPASDTLYWAVQGRGAYRQVKNNPADKLITSRAIDLNGPTMPASPGLQVCYILEGIHTVFVGRSEDVKEFLVGNIILSEAGGVMKSKQDGSIDYRSQNISEVIAASNGLLYRKFVKELSQ